MTLFSSFFISLLVSMLLVPMLVRVSARLGLVDIPDSRKVHVGAIPRSGGIAIVAGALVPLLIWWPDELLLRGVMLGALVIFVFGFMDDRKELHFSWKFLGQILASIIVIAAGVRIEILPFLGIEPVSVWVSYPLTLLFIVGVTNAINLSDGLDGLAAGSSLIALTALAWMFYQNQSIPLALVTLATLGGVCGFLRYNNHPAIIFMGDTGSQFLGFVTSVLAIVLTQKANTALNPAILLLLLGVPILDTLTVMMWRIRTGRSPFKPDRNHFHHRLLDFGFYHHEAVSIIYVVQSAMVVGAYFLRFESDLIVMGAYGLMCALILIAFRLARVNEFLVHRPRLKSEGKFRASELVRLYPRLPDFATRMTEALATLLMLGAALYPAEVLPKFAQACAGLAGVGIAVRFIPGVARAFFIRLITYVTGVVLVFALIGQPGFAFAGQEVVNASFLLVGASLLVCIQLTDREHFRSTPLDYLVMIFVLVIVIRSQLQAENLTAAPLADTAIRLAVVFYASEFLCRRQRVERAFLPIASIAALALLAVRGLAF
ncbi:MAG: MraY family glycosyltransferase [Gammaproteobacteria bacterium]